jgi:hypothetical protein
MDRFRGAIARSPLVVFFLLAYGLSWWSAPLTGGSIIPHGPFLAAIIVVGLLEGWRGVGAFLGRVFRWGTRWYWLFVAPALVIAYLAVAVALNVAFGATLGSTAHLAGMGGRVVELVLLGGVWEEPGWTGFALPALQARYAGRRYGTLQASLILGVLRGIWHIPLVVAGHIPWFDAVFLSMGVQLLVSWVYNRTGGSVLAVMLLHLVSNVVGGALVVPLFAGGDLTRFYVMFVALALVEGVLLARQHGWSVGLRSAPAGAPQAPQA